MTKLRILYLINNLEIGGAEIALANLVNELPAADFDVWIGVVYALGPIQKRFTLPSDRFVSFNFQIRQPFLDLPACLRLFRFLRRNRIQIIHTHLPLSNIIGRSVAWLAGVPVIISTEHNIYYDKSLPFVLADRLLSKITTQMTTISQAVRLFASNQAHLDPGKFLVIPNGIPLNQIPIFSKSERQAKKRELGIGKNQPVVITVGRLHPQKAHHVLLDAARRVVKEKPDVRFLLVGGGPCEQALKKQALCNGLEENVQFLGFRQDIPALLQISTVMVLSSLREGLSVALMEASACSLPIVASNVGGNPEIVVHGITGLLVPPGDEEKLADSILQILNYPKQRNSMGREGRRLVTERYTSDIVSDRTARLYRRLYDEYSVRNSKRIN
jgi:glycosyltransferase involved in cell wall biosynthesis